MNNYFNKCLLKCATCRFLCLALTVAAMLCKGFRRTLLSTDTKLDAGEDARKLLKPLLGIAVVGNSYFY
jgi:hypothetical protein